MRNWWGCDIIALKSGRFGQTLLQKIRKAGHFLLEETEKRKQTIKTVLRILRVLLVLAAVAGIVLWLQYSRTKEYKSYEITSETTLYTGGFDCAAGNGRLFVYGNDGAKAVDGLGKVQWELAYQLDNPQISWCEEVAAVADVGGTAVYVVEDNGIPYNYHVLYPIVKHEVAKQGVTAVLLDNGAEDYIQMYDKNGNLRVDIKTITKTDGIPVDIALSPDGKKLVTLYVTFQGDAMLGKVTFYNADEVGKNYINNIVGQKTFAENCLAYDVCFLEEDIVCILLENGFALYRMTEVPELILEKTLSENIVQFICAEGGFYLIKENAAQRTMSFYNTNGEVKKTWSSIPEYESVTATKEEIVFFSPQRVTGYRKNGSLKFSTAFTQSLETVLPAGGNRYFLLNGSTLQTIKLTNKIQE